MPTEQNYFNIKNINIFEYVLEVIHRWYICVAVIVVSLAVSLVYSTLIVTPQYDSTAKLYVVNKETSTISSSDFSISTYLVNDFSEIILDRLVLDEVAAQLGNKYTFSQLRSSLSVNIPQGTRIIAITARTPSASLSKQIVDTICRVAEQSLAEKIGLDRVTVISEGSFSKNSAVPNIQNNLLIALAISVCISLAVVFLIYLADNKISSSKDVEKYLDIKVLATIPYNRGKQA